MGFETVLFDLDGTLTDSAPGITNAVAYSLKHFGIEADPAELRGFIGPPLDDSFRKFYGFDAEKAVEAVREYRVYFADRGWAENSVYGGIEELLKVLKAAGKKLLVATSKPEVFAVRILEHFGLASYFDCICGAPMTPSESNSGRKADVIRDALGRGEVSGSVVMVGDRLHDVHGAHEVGLPVVGVLFGYGDREELESAGADMIAETVEDLKRILQNKNTLQYLE